MEVFISLSKKSVRKKSKTLQKRVKAKGKPTAKKSGKDPKKKSGFQRLSRRAQILYLKRHPKTRYTMADVKSEKQDKIEQAEEKDKIKKAPEEEKDTKKDKEETKPEDSDKADDKNLDPEDDPNADDEDDGDDSEEDDAVAKYEKLSDSDKADHIQGGMKNARQRASSIARNAMRNSTDDEVNTTLDDIDATRNGDDVSPSKRKETLKFLGKLAASALVIAAGAALAMHMGPTGILLAKEFMSMMMWEGRSTSKASERNEVAVVELTKDMIDFIADMDKKDLANLIKESERKSNNRTKIK